MNKIGMHIGNRNRDEKAILNLMAQLHREGRPMGLVTNLGGDEISCEAIRGASPLTTIVLRMWPGGWQGMGMTANQYFDYYIDPFAPRKAAHFHQINNEMAIYSPEAIAWWMQQMKDAEARGYRLAVGTYSTGTPPLPKEDAGKPYADFWLRSDVLAMLRYIRDHGHLLALHEYDQGDGNYGLGRFIKHVAFGDPNNKPEPIKPLLPLDLRENMPWFGFTEWGRSGGRDMSTDMLLGLLEYGQQLLAPYPRCLGLSWWLIGDTGDVPPPGDNFVGDNSMNKLAVFGRVPV